MKSRYWAGLFALHAPLLLWACDGQQYVSPDTVALVITNDETGLQRVNRCHYVPILLGSQITSRYRVEDELRATITVTREDVIVTFEDPRADVVPFVVDAEDFDGAHTLTAAAPPESYTVELRSPCVPDDD